MIKIKDFIFNKDKITYIKKHQKTIITVVLENGDMVYVGCHNEQNRDLAFNEIMEVCK